MGHAGQVRTSPPVAQHVPPGTDPDLSSRQPSSPRRGERRVRAIYPLPLRVGGQGVRSGTESNQGAASTACKLQAATPV